MQKQMKIGNRIFDMEGHTYIMGILNVTPDSFSDGGSYRNLDEVLYRAETMLQEGADILDVGGESTRPGHTVIGDEEEIRRVVPVIEALRSRFDAPISIDTYKEAVANAALHAGADMVNDIWGFQYDAKMAETVAKAGAACCLMHNQNGTDYTDLTEDSYAFLKKSVTLALAAGVAEDKIMLDPGIGFGKTTDQNLSVMKRLADYQKLGYPLLLGTSRKSMIGNVLNLPVNQRVEGTLVTTVLAVEAGWQFVRVHDIKENYRAIRMMEAIRDSL